MKTLCPLIAIMLTLAACATIKHFGVVNLHEPHLKFEITYNPNLQPDGKKPQFALWVSNKTTGEVRTIYATRKAIKVAAGQSEDERYLLPVWFGAWKKENQKRSVDIDTISSSTPFEKTFTIHWQIPEGMRNRNVEVYLEANVAGDYNNFYPKDSKQGDETYSGDNGQPSLVWKGEIFSGKDNMVPMKFDIYGHGQVLGINHNIERDLTSITTAKNLFGAVSVDYYNAMEFSAEM